MIDKENIKLMKKFLAYRFEVDQITEGSMSKEKTHMRYILLWAQDVSFRQASTIRPTFPFYMLSSRLDGEQGQLSAGYIKKALATARLFFTWLADNEPRYKHTKQAWIKTIKSKRLSDTPKNKEAVTLEEILAIAARPAYTVQARRARAGLIFLFLSGARIGAFVSLPMRAVDISNHSVYQLPDLGVRTKNRKSATTFLLDIPELLKVVQEWDDEVRAILPDNGFWFAPLSNVTGLIDAGIVKVGKHRVILASRSFKAWMEQENLPFHSPHKFRHGHAHYLLERAVTLADLKAISQNLMHSTTVITDNYYSNQQDDEIKNRISELSKNIPSNNNDDELFKKFMKFSEWDKGNST